MDNLTHSLVGALIGQAGLKRKTGLAMPALVIGANLPDVDVSCFLWLDGTEHLGFRRGITHGPIALFALPLALAGVLWGLDRWQDRRGQRRFGRPEGRLPVSFKWLYLLGLIACLTHPALDWLNVYGIRLLEPFSHRWFYGDTLFIIDVWLWLGLGFATWLSLRRERKGGEWRRPAVFALEVALLYVMVQYVISTLDRQDNASFVETISSPRPILSWERESIGVSGSGSFFLDGAKFGNTALADCDLAAARKSSSSIDAFLFWSRAPYVTLQPDGRYILADARFGTPGDGDRFSVILPQGTCEEQDR